MSNQFWMSEMLFSFSLIMVVGLKKNGGKLVLIFVEMEEEGGS